MRLLLDCPSSFYVEPLRSGVTNYRDPAEPRLRILVTSLVPRPPDVRVWRTRELYALVPDEHQLAVMGEDSALTTLGWPMRLVEAECRLRAVVVERWLAAFFEDRERIGLALVRAPRGVIDSRRWREIVALLATARPAAAARSDEEAGGSLSGPWVLKPTSMRR